MDEITVRAAMPDEAEHISQLLALYAESGKLLARPPEEILEHIRDFKVAVTSRGDVLGCAALNIYDATLAEVRSLAVVPRANGQGIGRRLMEACEQDGRQYHLQRLFALTYVPEFFEKNGYRRIAKESLPQKIWRDCFRCKLFPNCGETAVVKDVQVC